MLTLAVPWPPPTAGWTWNSGRYTSGSAWIEPFKHPSLEHWAVTDGRSTCLVFRERARGACSATSRRADVNHVDTAAYQDSITSAKDTSLEFVLIEISADEVELSAGPWGTAPLYLTLRGSKLYGSWSLPELVREHGINGLGLSDREVCRYLTLRHRYTSETLFRDVHRLTERARADFNGQRLRFRYPAPALHAQPRKLREGAPVLAFYEDLLEQAVQARDYTPENSVVEWSGGLDSANVALTLGTLHPGQCHSYALTLAGEIGRQQIRRRQVLIDKFGFRDMRVPAIEYLPFHPEGRRVRGEPVGPYDEPYGEAFDELLERARNTGIRVALTGIGGDELVAPYATEEEIPTAVIEARRPFPDWLGERAQRVIGELDEGIAPGAILADSSLRAFACRDPLLLRAGIWPVSPLCDPDLIRFGESLPYEWRRDKRLHRERLKVHGFSDEWLAPPLPETFSHIMEQGLQQHAGPLLQSMARASILADYGYLDTRKLSNGRHNAIRDRLQAAFLHAAIHLELSLRAVIEPLA